MSSCINHLAPIGAAPAYKYVNQAALNVCGTYCCRNINAVYAVTFSALNIALCPLKGVGEFTHKIVDMEFGGAFKALATNVWDGVKSIFLTAILVVFLAVSVFSPVNIFGCLEQKTSHVTPAQIAEITDLQKALKSLDAKSIALGRANKSLESEMASLRATHQECARKIDAAKAETATLRSTSQEQLDSIQRTHNSELAELATLKATKDDLSKKIAAAIAETAAITISSRRQIDSLNREHEGALTTLSSDLEASKKAEIETLKLQISGISKEREALQRRITELTPLIDHLEAYEARHQKDEALQRTTEREIKELREVVRQNESEISQQRGLAMSCTLKFNESAAANLALRKTNKKLVARIAHLQGKAVSVYGAYKSQRDHNMKRSSSPTTIAIRNYSTRMRIFSPPSPGTIEGALKAWEERAKASTAPTGAAVPDISSPRPKRSLAGRKGTPSKLTPLGGQAIA